MVQQGAFKVQLVEATSKNPFLEHSKNGQHFVEAEPNAEYYVRLERIPHVYAYNPGLRDLITRVEVDGLSIESGVLWEENDVGFSMDFGPKSCQNGIDTVHSLRFSRPDQIRRGDGSFSQERYLDNLGQIRVSVYEGNLNWTRWNQSANPTFQSLFLRSNNRLALPAPATGAPGKKFVLSKQGCQTITRSLPYGNFNFGKLLDVITLRYCTAQGLILAGALTKPPSFSWDRPLANVSPENSPNARAIPKYHTEMQQILENPTPDGNIPRRTVEVLVIEDDDDE